MEATPSCNICRRFTPHCNCRLNIFTARKRSLGQGNIFRSVCQEFCPQGGCMVWGVHGPGGAWSQGDAWSWGCMVLGGFMVLGAVHGPKRVHGLGGVCMVPGVSPPPGTMHTPQDHAPPPRGLKMATAVGGMHPTGMHSCHTNVFWGKKLLSTTACRKNTHFWLVLNSF